MADDNEYSVEANEAEMVAEGGAVQESTDPEVTEADETAAAESADSADNAEDTTEQQSQEMVAEGDVPEQPVQEADAEAVGDAEAGTDAEAATDPEAALAAESEESADAEYKARLRKYTRELKKLPGQWYIIQSYSGYENKVKTNLDMRIQTPRTRLHR